MIELESKSVATLLAMARLAVEARPFMEALYCDSRDEEARFLDGWLERYRRCDGSSKEQEK